MKFLILRTACAALFLLSFNETPSEAAIIDFGTYSTDIGLSWLGTEISLLITCGASTLVAGWMVARRLYKGLDRRIAEVQGDVREEVKVCRREILQVANAVLNASWHTRMRPRRVNAALPLILIAQIQRSGGTLLSWLFDGHPEVFAFPHELKWKDRWPQIDPRKDGPLQIASSLVAGNLEASRTFNLFGYIKEAPGARSSGDQRLPIQWSEWAYVEAFLEGWDTVRPQSRRQCFDVFMSAYFSALLTLRENDERKKIITAFGPPMDEAFFEDYPDGLMISICRHPADWYASATRLRSRYANVDHAMEQWRKSAENAMRLKERHPAHVVLLPFATLVADPSGVMRRLAERLGIAWHPILANPTFNGMPIGSNSSFESVVGIDASAVGRRNCLTPELRDQIEARNLAVYKQFLKGVDICS